MGIGMSGLSSGLDTDTIVQALVSTYTAKKETYTKEQTKLSWTQDAWKDLNKKIYNLYSGTLSDLRFSSAYNQKKTTISDSSVATVQSSTSSVNGTQTLGVQQLAKSGYLTGAVVSTTNRGKVSTSTTLSELGISDGTSLTVGVGGEPTDIKLTGDMTVAQLTSKLNSAGVNASFDATNQRFFISAKDSGLNNDFTLTSSDSSVIDSLGFNVDEENEDGTGATRIYGKNAIIYLNDAKFESSSNTFSINGLTITATDETGTDSDGNLNTVSLTTATDVDGIYDTIKNFFKEYNELINEMDSLYNAESASSYTMLSDDDKESMTDDEIEKWETKIKDSLLRRDSTLGTVADAMKNAMSRGVEIDGKTYYLSNFGINTLGYFNSADNEKNAYHIDGDEDDSSTSGNTDQLKTAIANDPDTVTSFFTGLTKNLYNSLYNKMQSTTLSSAYTVYNDKQMTADYKEYTDKISDVEDEIEYWEEYYYSRFTAMETALATLNSQTSQLSSLISG